MQIADWADQSAIDNLQSAIVFEVADTGPGIAADEQEHIFEAFVQTLAGEQAREGTGLGLAICRQFVQLMGGTLSVHSELGRGATFTVVLPLQAVMDLAPAADPTRRRVVALAPDLPRYRVLVVDDTADNRQLMIELLAPLGFELREARDGQEAIEAWRVWRPHLIWMDLRMPLLNGYDAARQIKAAADGPPPAIIALSASNLEEERAIVLAAGCDDFIRKPFRDSEIFEALSRHLDVRYIYEDKRAAIEPAPPSRQPADEPLTPAALAALPAALLGELQHVVRGLEIEGIDRVIADIRTHDARLAEALAMLVHDFKYDLLLRLIRAATDDR